jgi:outer membrane protein
LANELQSETAKFNEALHDSLEHFIAKYIKDKKYTYILTKQGDNILYADPALDITKEVVAGLNKAYKAKPAEEKKDVKKEEKKDKK